MSAITAITVPKWGIEMQTGTLTSWLVAVGDTVERGQPIAEVETDKIVNELEAPASGAIARILGEEDEEYRVGELIGVVAVAGTADADIDAFIAGFKPSDASFAFSDDDDDSAPAKAAESAPEPAAAPATEAEAPSGEAPRVMPPVRRLAESLGVDLTKVKGSGRNGRITQDDVKAAAEAGAGSDGSAAEAPASGGAGGEVLAQTSMQKASAKRLVEAKPGIPHFYLTRTFDVTAAVERGARINDLVVSAVGAALAATPAINANYVDGQVLTFADANVAVAVATDRGLITPVVKGVNKLGLEELGAAIKDSVGRARNGELQKADLEGGTFTVSNLGMMGIDEFSAIINPPQVGILAVGQVRACPVVDESGNVVVRQVMSATLSVDHRAADGAEGARFLGRIADILEA